VFQMMEEEKKQGAPIEDVMVDKKGRSLRKRKLVVLVSVCVDVAAICGIDDPLPSSIA